ncbi:BTB/POZ domain-containing protein [Rhizophagus irregularis DAOM 181602=DAOM 197198]|uniref:Uncharacterized protein n=1 Tax=Rhizophagus irregularis (strain DAOM 181602 / DAOM 197198 / MUCL 43194) TaxID=747089 RepID=A0A2P4QSR5_RHIID|nr:hypothetical protein GLOIN_2v1764253 [Rhizophagus irregularis DAOM 181602=DAOM 197198]POG80696.1 hypothetical protein GLOIN_2v1764253 [Rhizophagus irregularis DAOM 181602=DAOM 197198]GET54236.1 BTB/POZ domain-containing protein [Rhizophagus irregularis DAOM 181602=DAOM 197198]|eukprot:XP_025187562.1 hypothetical protein GLOIN_2v1764253 [Rhizophagus irregularis DAOM 181602=DAOM 197198]
MQSELDLLKQHVLAENATFTRRFSFKKIYPFKELLPNDLVNNILEYHLVPNKKPDNIQLSRCWSSIINSQHFKVFGNWIEKKKIVDYCKKNLVVGNISHRFELIYLSSKDDGGSNPRFSYPKVGIPVRFIIKDYETFQAIRFESLKNIDRLKKVIQ